MYSSKHFNISEDAAKLKVLNNGKKEVPKWLVLSGLIIFVVSVAFLGVSLGIAVTCQPSCSPQSCENQLKTNQPSNLSLYDGICGQNDHCKLDEFLVCNDSFRCSCSMDRYWDAKISRCILRKRFNEACDGDECQSNLSCQSHICKCPNDKKFFFDGKNCQPKLIFNQSCESSDECSDSENTICQNFKCSCNDNEYFKLEESKCVPKLNEFDYCSFDQMCQSPMLCSIKFDCRCPGYFYYENTTSSCNNKLMVDARCNKNHQCRQDLGLMCINGKCLCSSLKYTWSPRSLKCKLTYQKSICTADSDCNNSENLVCQLKNPNSQFYRTCGCIKEEDNENYWNGVKCVQAKTYRSDCLSNDHCKILTENTFCSMLVNKCECPNLHYWNGYKCMQKKAYLETCLDSFECVESQLLICNGTKCSCNDNEYFKLEESKCVPKLNEFDYCSFDQMCQSPMLCSIKFDCRCPGYFYYENTTSSCNNKLMVDARCNKNHQCRQDLGLMCINGKCLCSSLKNTWSPRSLKCKLTYQKSICTADSDCNNSENLVCQLKNPNSQFYRTCGCIKEEDNENYWNGVKCVQAKTYRSDCLSNDHCKILTENTFCSMLVNKCECPNLHYWNGYKCMQKKAYLETCLDSFECVESQLLICNGTKCVCDETKYFDSDICLDRLTEFEKCFSTDMCLKDMVCNNTHCVCSENYYYSDKCVPQKLLNQKCEKDFECWSEKGLVCDSNICTCELSYTWSISKSKCLLTYGKKGCNNNNECNQDEKLICVDENFNHEIGSQVNLCNCSRNSNPEQYWNGSQCIEAKEFNFPCKFDFECRTRTQKTHCINSSCVCFDFSSEYWDSNECKAKKIHMEDCSQNIECLDSEQTKCSGDGKCRCPEGRYFNKEARMCAKKLGEWEKCEENEMCLGEMSCNQYACSCGQDKYFRKKTNRCVEKKNLNGFCSKDDECSNEKNLVCMNKNCSCSKEKYTWNTNVKKCKFTYSIECNDHDDCDESKGLKCKDYLDRCFCPSNNSGKICDCKKNEQYWDGLKCTNKKSFSTSCKMSSECRKDLVCLDNMCRCQFYEKENKGECKKKCQEDSVYFKSKCYFFTAGSKSASKADSYCKSLTVGSEHDWKLAKISPGIENEFASYVRHKNIKGDFWIKDKNGKMKNFRINSFYNDITLKTPLKVICVDD